MQHAFADLPMSFPKSGVEIGYASLLRFGERPRAQNKDCRMSDHGTVIVRAGRAFQANPRARRIDNVGTVNVDVGCAGAILHKQYGPLRIGVGHFGFKVKRVRLRGLGPGQSINLCHRVQGVPLRGGSVRLREG